MTKLLEKRNTIYGVLAIWIIVFHIFRLISMPYIPIITNIIGIGNMGVDVFFFFSGLCLCLSAKKHHYQEKGWKGYYKRRAIRILIPYLIIGIPYYLWEAIFESSDGIIHKIAVFLANISSLSFWLKGTQTTWYAYGILLFYFFFPYLYGFIVKSNLHKRLILLWLTIGFAIISSYIPILDNGVLVWARLPIFIIGIMAGTISKKEKSKVLILTTSSSFLVLGAIISFSELSESFEIPQVYRLLLYIPMTLSLMYNLSFFLEKVAFFEWIGGLSLEVYLIHITLLHPIRYYGILDTLNVWLYLILPIITIIFAWFVGKIERIIIKKLGV